MKIPFVDLTAQYLEIKSSVDSAIAEVIQDTAFIGGKFVKKFEAEFAALYGVNNVISCANGTDSLYIIMKMLGIGTGDEVVTVANSWISSSETITQTGARVVFVDAEPLYYGMDAKLLERAITPSTKAVIAVHLQGQICDIENIKNICDKHNIALIEDCAQSHFSELNGVRAGLRGIAGSFSFYPGKNLGAYGDAGCIITQDNQLAERCRMFANHGALKKPHHIMEGVNSRMDGLQAAVLSAKLPHILEWTEKRIEKASLYNQYLEGVSEIVLPEVRPSSKHSFHLYVIKAKNRDGLADYLMQNGVETFIHYPTPLPFLKAYEYLKHKDNDFPIVAKLQHEILSLPLFPELKEEQIEYITGHIKDFYKRS